MLLYDQNIWGNYGKDHTVGNRAELVADLIEQRLPDICCFQECNPATIRVGKNGIQERMEDLYDEICASKAVVNFTPVFVKRGVFKVIAEEHIPFEGLNDLQSKSVTYAVLERRMDGKRFAVASTHFWWQRGEESDRQREENARTLGMIANRLKEAYHVPMIVAGDFNSGYDGLSQGPAGYEAMLSQGFQDVRTISKVSTASKTCRNDYPIRSEQDAYVGGTLPTYTIDYIFTRGEGIQCNAFDVLLCQTALNSSDHCPLTLEFEIL